MTAFFPLNRFRRNTSKLFFTLLLTFVLLCGIIYTVKGEGEPKVDK